MGYFDKYAETQEPTLSQIESEQRNFVEERGTTMDILHDLAVGTSQALDIAGRGLHADGLLALRDRINQSSIAKQDVSQYYGTQSRLGRVVDGIVQTAPTSLGLMAATAGGAALGGPVLGSATLTGGLGIIGSGVYDQSYEEISKERPDLSEDDKVAYSLVNALSEVGTEALGDIIPFGIGKLAGKGASKAVVKALVDSGRLTPKQAVSTVVANAGGKNVAKALVGSAAADGASEVVNELVQAANREHAGLKKNPVDLIDVFLIGSAPGGIIAGGTMALDTTVKAKVRGKLESGLQSESRDVRMETLDTITQGLSNVSPELGTSFRDEIFEKVLSGPVSLEEEIITKKKEEAQKADIINEPEKVLEENGIPSGIAPGEAVSPLRTEKRDFSERPLASSYEKQVTPPSVTEGIEKEMAQRKALEQEKKAAKQIVKNFMSVARDSIELPKKRVVLPDGTEKMVPSTISEASVPLYDALILDNARSQAIKQGMEKVIVDTNKLAEVTDLDEREALQKGIKKTTRQIQNEVESHVRETAKTDDVATTVTEPSSRVEPEVTESSTKLEPVKAEEPKGSNEVNKKKVTVFKGEEPKAYQSDKEVTNEKSDTLDAKGLQRASKLMEEGVSSEDAAILAKRGIDSVKDNPVEIEKGRWTTGDVIEKGSNTKGKKWKVIGKDGIERRASTKKEAIEAVKNGTVHKLELYNEVSRKKKVDKKLEPLDAEGQESVASFIKEHSVKDIKGKLNVTNDSVGEAVVRTVAEGKELTLANVRKTLRSLAKSEENATDSQKMAREGLRSDVVSAEEMFASQEAEAVDAMDDVEAEDIIGDGEDTTETSGVDAAAEAAIPVQKGKGSANLRSTTYYLDGDTWKKISKEKAKKLPEGTKTEVRVQTPDGAYEMRTRESKDSEGITRVTVDVLDRDGTVIREGLSDRHEAEEVIKWERELENLSLETDAQRVANNWKALKKGNVQKAIVALKDTFEGPDMDPVIAEAIKILEAVRDSNEKYEAAFLAKYPTAYELLDDVVNAEKSGGDSAKLAKYLADRANVGKLKSIKVQLGDKNSFNGKTNTITLVPYADHATRLHEIVHAFTVNAMKSSKELRGEIVKLRDMALEHAVSKGLITEEERALLEGMKTSRDFIEHEHDWKNRSIAYGLLNEKEFLSQAFSSKDFQEMLNDVKVEKKRSALDKLIDRVLKALGLTTEYNTVMREVLAKVPDVSYVDVTKSDSTISESAPPTVDEVVAKVMAKGGPDKEIRERLFEQGKNIKNFAEYLLRPTSDIIRTYSEKIYGNLMKMETKLIMDQKRYSTKVKPFMEWYKGLTKSQQVRYNTALMNSNLESSEKVIAEIPKKVMDPVREVLEELRQRQEAVGLSTANRKNYFPRRVKDVAGLMDYMLKDEEYRGPIGQAFALEAKRLGVSELTPEQRTQVMSDMFQTGYLRQLPRPGASKERTVPFVTDETYGFYADANDAIMGHIFEMNEKIGQREFIGGSTRKKAIQELLRDYSKIKKMDDGPEKDLAIAKYDAKAKQLEDLEADLQNGVAALVYEEMGKAPAGDQLKMIDLINSRMRQRGAHGVIDHMRNISYVTTMGNFLSAITQLGDIPILFYAHGINKDSVSAVGTAFKNVYKIARNELRGKTGETDAFVDQADFTNQLREFSQGNVTAKWVEKAFQLSGLKFTDLIGKEAFMQAGYKKWQRKENKDAFMERYEPMFGEDTKNVYRDIQLGKTTDDVMAVLLSELSDFQPITLSQQPQKYLTGGNARIFYMLKTFTLRSTSAALREGAKEINKGGAKNIAKGVAKAGSILSLYAAAGAGADELKDLIRGRESSITDNTIDNLIQMFFMSKYSIDKGLQRDNLVKTIMSDLMPPVRYMDTFAADVYALASDEKEFKAKSIINAPFIGPIVYSHSAAKKASSARMMKQDILDQVRENKKSRKGAYSGRLQKQIDKYNKLVSRDEKITHATVMRAYRSK